MSSAPTSPLARRGAGGENEHAGVKVASRWMAMLMLSALSYMMAPKAGAEDRAPATIADAAQYERRLGAKTVIKLSAGHDPSRPSDQMGNNDVPAHPDFTVTGIARRQADLHRLLAHWPQTVLDRRADEPLA